MHTCVCASGGVGEEPAGALWGRRARPTLLPQRGGNSTPDSGRGVGVGGSQIPDSARRAEVSRPPHFFRISSSEDRSGEEQSREGD